MEQLDSGHQVLRLGALIAAILSSIASVGAELNVMFFFSDRIINFEASRGAAAQCDCKTD